MTVTTEKLTIDSFSVPFGGASFQDTVRDSVTVTRDGRMSAGHHPRPH